MTHRCLPLAHASTPSRTKRQVPLLLLCASLAATSAATSTALAAEDPPRDPAALFKKLDINNDGRLSHKEIASTPAIAGRFDEFDQNGDGYLSVEEFAAAFKVLYQGG